MTPSGAPLAASPSPAGDDAGDATPPESTKSSLSQRLRSHAAQHWPQLSLDIRFRGPFAYLDGQLGHDEPFPLCRQRYRGCASTWGFALYLYSSGTYEDQILPTGSPAGSPEDAPDYACQLDLN